LEHDRRAVLIAFACRFHSGEPAAKAQDANYYLLKKLRSASKAARSGSRSGCRLPKTAMSSTMPRCNGPNNRQMIPFGSVVLTRSVPDDDQQQKRVIFDPVPRVDVIEPFGGPAL
jgi:catalase